MDDAVQHGKEARIERISALHAALYRSIIASNPRPWIELDLTMQQLKVLLLLHFTGPHNVSTLAERLGVRLPTVTGVLDRLVEHGLIVRDHDRHDRRVVQVRLSPEGGRLIERLHSSNLAILTRLLQRLEAGDLDALERGLLALKRVQEGELDQATAAPLPAVRGGSDRSVETGARGAVTMQPALRAHGSGG